SAHAHASALPRNPLPPPITTFMRVLDDGSAWEVCCFIMAAHPTMRHFLCVVVFLLLPSLGLAQEKTIPVPAGVKVEAIPPGPQTVAYDLAQYAQYRSAQMQAWHPSKRQIVITTIFGATPQLHLVDGPGRGRRQITWIPAGISIEQSTPSFDPADGNTLVF